MLYTQATLMAQGVGIKKTAPHLASRQKHRQNIQAQSCSDYYHLNLAIPLVDHLNSELSTCFDAAASQNVAEFMHLLP